MQIAMVGLGRMGSNMVRRLLRAGHECIIYNRSQAAVEQLRKEGATGASSFEELAEHLHAPRAVWLMVPAAAVDAILDQLVPFLAPGDAVIDGGNSNFRDDIRRATELKTKGMDYIDVGTSGGIAGLERGYCLMIGGPKDAVRRLEPIFSALAPGEGAASRTADRAGPPVPEERGYLNCGGPGAGHFVKMVHNGIEYGLMQAYAEGFNILRHANIGNRATNIDAETAPASRAEFYKYDFELERIAELWRRGSVIPSWLLDLTASALLKDPELKEYAGRVSDSGEGRWTIEAAIDEGIPVPVLSAALYSRLESQGQSRFANQTLSAMRHRFGGHTEKTGA